MRALALVALLTLSFPAFAASVSIDGLVETVVWLIVVAVVFGLLILLVRKAPFIPLEWKSGIEYFIYFVIVLVVINLLLGLIGKAPVTFR